ncbi:MAG: hypothetical protein NT027_08230 [Proteobacteria bacterium]|nr:hypothetical protein [Pseudomonadota bacterium]
MKNLLTSTLTCMVMLVGLNTCGKKTMSERDVRREQLRLNAHKKRIELANVVGNYRGTATDTSLYAQDISLQIDVQDTPESDNGQTDPVLVPSLNGALSYTYGSGDTIDLVNFPTTKTDFSLAGGRLDLVVSNSEFKEINLSLQKSGDTLTGTWTAPSASESGKIQLIKVSQLHLGGETPSLKGQYAAIFEWDKAPAFANGKVTLSSAQDSADGLHLSAAVKIFLESKIARETYVYEYDRVEFNPLTRQVSIRSDTADIYMVGHMNKGIISGTWYSKRAGVLGRMTLSPSELPSPQNNNHAFGASGSWLGQVTNTHPNANLPQKLMISFNNIPNSGAAGGLTLIGNARFYFGSGNDEYFECPFATVEYSPFWRKITAVTSISATLPTALTFQLDMTSTGLEGVIIDSALGTVAKVRVTESEN